MHKRFCTLLLALTLIFAAMPVAYAVDDHQLSVGYIIEEYLPDDILVTAYHVGTRQEQAILYDDTFSTYNLSASIKSNSEMKALAVAIAEIVIEDSIPATVSGLLKEGSLVFSSLESGVYLLCAEDHTHDNMVYTVSPVLVQVPSEGTVYLKYTSTQLPVPDDPPPEEDPPNSVPPVPPEDPPAEVPPPTPEVPPETPPDTPPVEPNKPVVPTPNNPPTEGLPPVVVQTPESPKPPKQSGSILSAKSEETSTDEHSDTVLVNIVITKEWVNVSDVSQMDSVRVQLLDGSTVVRTASLSRYNDWSATFHGMNPGGHYSVQEVEVPNGFTSTVSRDGDSFVVTNTWDGENFIAPDQEDIEMTILDDLTPLGKLPQTGQNWYPMFAALALGIALAVVWAVCRWRERYEEK